jgi:hypothetical protein
MNAEELKAKQGPVKQQYREHPEAALITLRAEGRAGEGIRCKLETGKALVEAGLHPATGGSGASACSGDMLLEALVACAGCHIACGGDRAWDPVAGRNCSRRRRHRFSRHARGFQRSARWLSEDQA